MNNLEISEPFANNLQCEVCGASITYPESLQLKELGYLVCQSFDCRKIMSQKSTMTPLLFETQLQFHKNRNNERREKEEARKKYIKEARVREDLENLRILKYVQDKNPEFDKINIPLVVIPSGLSEIEPLSQERIISYKENLNRIIGEVIEELDNNVIENSEQSDANKTFDKTDELVAENSSNNIFNDRLCGLCKGACCTSGAEHAYLSSNTIKRFLNTNLDKSVQDMLELYYSKISSETIVGACINQTQKGCALPKEMRSDTCNDFYCESLKQYQKNVQVEKNSEVVAVIQRAATCWNSLGPEVCNDVTNVVLLDEEGIYYQDLSDVTMESIEEG